MTMAEVLEAIQGMGQRFDRQDLRLKALERENRDGLGRRRRRGQEES